jgi:dTDP-4-dehydrorhamnose reductase
LQAHPDIQGIINCAAYSKVDLAEQEPTLAFESNALVPEILAIAAKEFQIPFLHISTDYVFPNHMTRSLTEEDPTAPCNLYGQTKLEGEERVLRISSNHTIVRTSWVFGDRGHNLIAMLPTLLKTRPKLYLNQEQVGRPTYAFDLVQALTRLLGLPGIYHVANRHPTTKYYFALHYKTLLAPLTSLHNEELIPVDETFFPSSIQRPLFTPLDTTKAEALLGPFRPWQEALQDHVQSIWGSS